VLWPCSSRLCSGLCRIWCLEELPRAMVDAVAVQFFRAQQENDSANNVCCDTGNTGPQWASPSHGIYISIEAAGAHRSLGVRVSKVLSTTMDSWKPLHLKMMELGGNRRFSEFLREHNVPEDMPIRQKYRTRAAEWYRENLEAMAEGTQCPVPLVPGTGHMPQSDPPSPGQLMLDKIFADAPNGPSAPCPTPSSSSGVARRAKSLHVVRRSRTAANQSAEHALPKLLGSTSRESISSADSGSPKPKSKRHKVSEQLQWLFATEGERSAERLRTMSTGTMPGFGPSDCRVDCFMSSGVASAPVSFKSIAVA